MGEAQVKQIVLNVDQAAMFDLVARSNNSAAGVGNRLAAMVLGGGEMDFLEALGLAVYGITVVDVKDLTDEEASK
jgi:hypothetical protein